MRLGILGGTFDPPHIGHLLAASDAVEFLELDRLLFVPAGVPPFKASTVEASPEQRLRMLELTVGGDLRFAIDPAEIHRTGLSYTVDTVAALAAREPAAERFLLIGEDLVEQIGRWRDAPRIPALATVVALARGGRPDASGGDRRGARGLGSSTGDHDDEARSRLVAREAVPPDPFPVIRIPTRRVDLSSSEIRERVRLGKSIHGFVTDGVAAFIETAALYR